MLSGRVAKVVWSFILGATVVEGAALGYSFRPHGNWLVTVWRYSMHPPGTPAAWCFAAMIMGAYVAHAARRSPVIRHYAFRPDYWRPFAALRLVAILMALVTGFFEELMFRKVFMDYAAASGYGVALQILVSAVTFGAVHAIWGLFAGKLRAAMAAMIATGALGGLLALDYIIGNRSLAPCAAAHIGINLILEPWLILTAVSDCWGKASMPPAWAAPTR
ncbi:MAG TPA: CPBP family intramembrane glutamic endopeptidase [Steroidobacteraceae bacterium]|jgi:hypothetical protein|nr:CPBP family intramembrane glutamic endopeptidase [Steroidobacteraceae bacterium]